MIKDYPKYIQSIIDWYNVEPTVAIEAVKGLSILTHGEIKELSFQIAKVILSGHTDLQPISDELKKLLI